VDRIGAWDLRINEKKKPPGKGGGPREGVRFACVEEFPNFPSYCARKALPGIKSTHSRGKRKLPVVSLSACQVRPGRSGQVQGFYQFRCKVQNCVLFLRL